MKPLSPQEKAWLEEFEVLNGRKPSPKEMEKAFAQLDPASTARVREFSNQAKLVLSLLVLGLLIIITVLMVQLKQERSQPSQATSSRSSSSLSSSPASSQKKSSSSTSSSSSSTSSSSQPPSSTEEAYNSHQESRYWNSSKASQLADFMVTWGQQMKQPGYKELELKLPIDWQDGSPLSSDWTPVAAYEYWYDNGTKVHRYIFVIKSDGQNQVLYSQDTNGAAYYVRETQNSDLSNGFAGIVAGN